MKKGLPLVSCLMATHGRYREVSRTVGDFLRQDYQNKELLILNNHPEPLSLPELSGADQVRVIHEPGIPTQGACRVRLLEEVRGEYVRTWDDDDAYLPWTISQGVAHIGDEVAFKPRHSWFNAEGEGFRLEDNVFEAAMLVRADFAREHPYQPTAGDEHHTLIQAIEQAGGCKRRDFGVWASYVYRWGFGIHHISGSIGSGSVEERTQRWKESNQDTGKEAGGILDISRGFGERIDLYHKMAPFAGEYRNEFFSRCASETPPESLPAPPDQVHRLATKDLVAEGQKFCAMEFGRDANGSTRQLLNNPQVGLLMSVDPDLSTFDAVKTGLSMEDHSRFHPLAELGDCSPCAIKCQPNYLTLSTGCGMESLSAFLNVHKSLAPGARISVRIPEGHLIRTVLEPTHRCIYLGDFMLFYPRYIPEYLHWPPAVWVREECEE